MFREFEKRSKNYPFGDHFLNSQTLLGLKGLNATSEKTRLELNLPCMF